MGYMVYGISFFVYHWLNKNTVGIRRELNCKIHMREYTIIKFCADVCVQPLYGFIPRSGNSFQIMWFDIIIFVLIFTLLDLDKPFDAKLHKVVAGYCVEPFIELISITYIITDVLNWKHVLMSTVHRIMCLPCLFKVFQTYEEGILTHFLIVCDNLDERKLRQNI